MECVSQTHTLRSDDTQGVCQTIFEANQGLGLNLVFPKPHTVQLLTKETSDVFKLHYVKNVHFSADSASIKRTKGLCAFTDVYKVNVGV